MNHCKRSFRYLSCMVLDRPPQSIDMPNACSIDKAPEQPFSHQRHPIIATYTPGTDYRFPHIIGSTTTTSIADLDLYYNPLYQKAWHKQSNATEEKNPYNMSRAIHHSARTRKTAYKVHRRSGGYRTAIFMVIVCFFLISEVDNAFNGEEMFYFYVTLMRRVI